MQMLFRDFTRAAYNYLDRALNQCFGSFLAQATYSCLAYNQLHIVLGFVKDKDVRAALSLFPKDAKYYFVRPSIPRGMDAFELQELAKELGMNGEAYKSVEKGLKKAIKKAEPNDMVYVGGSTFVVAEVV